MGAQRFSEETILAVLEEARNRGNVRAVCREHGITEQTFYRWRKNHPGFESDAQRLRVLQDENTRLKQIVVELMMLNRQLREATQRESKPTPGGQQT